MGSEARPLASRWIWWRSSFPDARVPGRPRNFPSSYVFGGWLLQLMSETVLRRYVVVRGSPNCRLLCAYLSSAMSCLMISTASRRASSTVLSPRRAISIALSIITHTGFTSGNSGTTVP